MAAVLDKAGIEHFHHHRNVSDNDALDRGLQPSGCGLQQEKPLQWEAAEPQQSRPRLLQLEKHSNEHSA